MTRLLAIDTSSAWCSVALSLGEEAPRIRHELVSAGASQLLLPWVDDLLAQANLRLENLDAIAVGIGPGAFTGVRLGIAAVQGLAIAAKLPVLPVASLDAIAAQVIHSSKFLQHQVKHFVVAIDARMDEVYWAKYAFDANHPFSATRLGQIHLCKPEQVDLSGAQYIAGSAIKAYGTRLFIQEDISLDAQDADLGISALGILSCAKQMFKNHLAVDVHHLEPLYVRDKVALTTDERNALFNQGATS